MYEEVIKNKEELNVVAAHLRIEENFDELRLLAKKWYIPLNDTEHFILGKRYQLADTELEEKVYQRAEDKLMEEMWNFPDDIYVSQIAHYLLQKSADEGFEGMVLKQHKSLKKCMDYIMTKAYDMAMEKRKDDKERSFGMALHAKMVYQWAEEYYLLNDVESEAKRKEEERQRIQKEREIEAEQKTRTVKRKEKYAGKEKKSAEVKQTEKKKVEVTQLSLFDTMAAAVS